MSRDMDPRFARSARALVDAIEELLTLRPAGEISVTDIVQVAGVSRPTFYQHHADVADAINTVTIVKLTEQLDAVDRRFVRPATTDDVAVWTTTIAETITDTLRHLDENRDFYRHALAGPGAHELFDRLVGLVGQRILERSPFCGLGAQHLGKNDEAQLIAGGVVWWISRWVQRSPDGPDDSVAATAARMAHSVSALALAALK